MCATCYAINKKAAKILNKNENLRKDINEIFEDSSLENMKYTKDTIDYRNNIFHVVEILYNKKEEIAKHIKKDLSHLKVATHHACHYCKVFYKDTIEGVRNPRILDELVKSCGVETIDWYNEKRTTCGAGFRQRFVNKELSLDVTADKLLSLHQEDVDLLLHMCPNCHMQFDRYQPYIGKKLNKNFKTIHLNISQFIALVMGADPYKTVGIQTHTIPIEPIIKK
jgi:heterodisulfide reductase subunit B